MTKIAAIILAAGNGSRIGCPKWQLPLQNGNFLTVIIDKLTQLDFSEIICVVQQDAPLRNDRIKWVVNHNPEQGMISSIYCGVNADDKQADGYLIMPVDHPLVALTTLRKICEEFRDQPTSVIRPAYNNRAGHPIVIPKQVAKKIPETDVTGGLQQILTELDIINEFIKVNDKGIIGNINTTEELSQAMK